MLRGTPFDGDVKIILSKQNLTKTIEFIKIFNSDRTDVFMDSFKNILLFGLKQKC